MIDIKRRKLWDKLISLLIWVLKKLPTIIAIVFSSITLYYQFFWKSCDINALVTGKLLDKECSQLEDAFTIDIAFMNNGNQYAIISKVSMILPLKLLDHGSIYTELRYNRCENDSAWPVIVKPGEIVVKRFEFVYRGEKSKAGSIRWLIEKGFNTGDLGIPSEKSGEEYIAIKEGSIIPNTGIFSIITQEDMNFLKEANLSNYLYLFEKYGNKEAGYTKINAKIRFTVIRLSGETKTNDLDGIELNIKEQKVHFFKVTQKIIKIFP